MAVRRSRVPEDHIPVEVPLPPPVPGGSEPVDDLPLWTQRLVGAERIRRRAAAARAERREREPSAEPAVEEPPPVELPPPVPGGNESFTRGAPEPGAEER